MNLTGTSNVFYTPSKGMISLLFWKPPGKFCKKIISHVFFEKQSALFPVVFLQQVSLFGLKPACLRWFLYQRHVT
jgi:hypothetical protein